MLGGSDSDKERWLGRPTAYLCEEHGRSGHRTDAYTRCDAEECLYGREERGRRERGRGGEEEGDGEGREATTSREAATY